MSEERPAPDLETMRHSAAHLMAAAIEELWPGTKFGVGPATKNGFFYDIDTPEPITADDLPKIEARMRKLRKKKHRYERQELPIDEAIEQMRERGQTYKVELLELLRDKGSTAVAEATGDDAVADGDGAASVSFYRTGGFVDLCRGPHVDDSKQIGHFKLINIAGAYWRGDEKNPQLTRIYGLAFDTKEELDKCVWQIEEAKKRDHRRLGKQLELFIFDDKVGAGLPLWLPNGAVLRKELERLATEEERRDGYTPVSTPVITKENLYYTSGHLPYYADDMYAPIEIDEEKYYLRPMNCPHHHMLYGHRPRSYRELPVRLAEYGMCHRYEKSGVLSGLMRVRGFMQNDAHIYCRMDQAKEEFIRVMRLHVRYYELFDITDYYMLFALPDLENLAKFVDAPDDWRAAMDIIRAAMVESGYPFVEKAGDAAFYGPKVDFMIENTVGKEYAISTNQLDFMATQRFGLTYKGEDGEEHPLYVIHRAPLGSHERFIAFLIEHYGGAFPTWLSPVQAVVIPISDRHEEHALKVRDRLFAAEVHTATGGLRVEADLGADRMQKKIRNAQLQKIPYMLVVGDREVEQDEVTVRHRSGADLGSMKVAQVVDRLRTEAHTRRDLPIG